MNEPSANTHSREMDIMKIIAILLVVMGHFGMPGLQRLQALFPEYGYHMAMFLFVSGYLFRDIDWVHYPIFLWKKTKHLALPLLGWNLVYACIVWLCAKGIDTTYLPTASIFSVYNLLEAPFLHGHHYILNLATWYVGMFYLAIIVYGGLHLLKRYIPEWAGLILLLAVGIVDLWVVRTYGISSEVERMLMRLPYALFFIHLGRCFRLYAEGWMEKVPAYIALVVLLAAQLVISHFYGPTIYIVVWMNFNGHILLPYIVGGIGILAWYQIVRMWSKWIPAHRLETVLSRSTWSIMTHHLFIRFGICYLLCRAGAADWNMFQSTIWYTPMGWYIPIFLAAICLPTIWQIYFDKLKKAVTVKINGIAQKPPSPRS